MKNEKLVKIIQEFSKYGYGVMETIDKTPLVGHTKWEVLADKPDVWIDN